MPTYIALLRYTPQGIQNMKQSPARLKKAKELIKSKGGEMKATYLTIGHYDGVAIIEAPNDEAYAESMLAIAAAGAVRTETLRAFTEKEYQQIIKELP